MAFAVAKNERFAVAPAFPEDGAGRKAAQDPRPSPGAMLPRGWPGGLRKNCHPETRAQPTGPSLRTRHGAALPGLPSHSQAKAARADGADDKADHTAKR